MEHSEKMCGLPLVYKMKGAMPPVFVAGTFSDPAWALHEMEAHRLDDGEYYFLKSLRVPENTKIEYKFRIGTGDWWVVDEDQETVTDAQGNVNNVITSPDWDAIGMPDQESIRAILDDEAVSLGDNYNDDDNEYDDGHGNYDEDDDDMDTAGPPCLPHEQFHAAANRFVDDDEDAPPAFGYEHAGIFPTERLPSPLVRATRRSSSDLSALSAELSPSTSPTMSRSGHLLGLPAQRARARTPERNSSHVSLNSIPEEEDTGSAQVSGKKKARRSSPLANDLLRELEDGVLGLDEDSKDPGTLRQGLMSAERVRTSKREGLTTTVETPKALGKQKLDSMQPTSTPETMSNQTAPVMHNSLTPVRDADSSMEMDTPATVIHTIQSRDDASSLNSGNEISPRFDDASMLSQGSGHGAEGTMGSSYRAMGDTAGYVSSSYEAPASHVPRVTESHLSQRAATPSSTHSIRINNSVKSVS